MTNAIAKILDPWWMNSHDKWVEHYEQECARMLEEIPRLERSLSYLERARWSLDEVAKDISKHKAAIKNSYRIATRFVDSASRHRAKLNDTI
jgi:Mg2+ and Co2+ transporter CorA